MRQSQITTSQAVFTAALAVFATVQAGRGALRARYEYGTHTAAIHQQQIAATSQIFRVIAPFPQAPILGLKRDFPVTQEEQPLDVPSAFFLRTSYLASTSTQTPVRRPWLQSWPQESQEQAWSAFYSPAAPPVAPPQAPSPVRFVLSYPQEPATFDVWNLSDIYEPIGQPGPVAISLQPPTLLGLEDPGVDPTTLQGTAQLRWAAVPGVSAYRVYINGVPQNPPIMGQAFRATGLVVGQQYKFAVVAVAQGIDDSPLSNEIYYEHGTNEFVTVTKYPWGNTFKVGYILNVKLFTPV